MDLTSIYPTIKIAVERRIWCGTAFLIFAEKYQRYKSKNELNYELNYADF